MILTFRLEDAVLQLTAKDLDGALADEKPIWIALSNGPQCIAGFQGGQVNHMNLGMLVSVHGLDPETFFDSYLLQHPWIANIASFDGG